MHISENIGKIDQMKIETLQCLHETIYRGSKPYEQNNHLPQVNCTNEKVFSDISGKTNTYDENQQKQTKSSKDNVISKFYRTVNNGPVNVQ